MPDLVFVENVEREVLAESGWDAIVAIGQTDSFARVKSVQSACDVAKKIDAQVDEAVTLQAAPGLAGGRLVMAPTGRLDRDYDDVRRYADAARQGILRARDAGARRPLVLVAGVPDRDEYARALEVSLLGVLGGLWEPLEAREALGVEEVEPIQTVGFWSEGVADPEKVRRWVLAMESGRRVARDLGGTQPERMTPEAMAAYCRNAFEGTPVRVEIVQDAELQQGYPLIAAVARASMHVERHKPRVIRLTYGAEAETQRTLLFAGKGLVYDT
ncbi:MAG: leucyl aminopeptidase family protein, partial [Candidatus Krumholzibacteriia bacterium]